MENEHLCPALAQSVHTGKVREHFFLKLRQRSQAGMSRAAFADEAEIADVTEAEALAIRGAAPAGGSPGAEETGLGNMDGLGGGRAVAATAADTVSGDETSGTTSEAVVGSAVAGCGGNEERGSAGGEADRREVGGDGDARRTRNRWKLDLTRSGDIATVLGEDGETPTELPSRIRGSVGRSLCAGASHQGTKSGILGSRGGDLGRRSLR